MTYTRNLTLFGRRYVNPSPLVWYPALLVLMSFVLGIIFLFTFVVYWVLALILPGPLAVIGAFVALLSICKFNGKHWWQHL